MRRIARTPQFERDLKKCVNRHWEIEAFKDAVCALAQADEMPLDAAFKDHVLEGKWAGKRAIHVRSRKQPPHDKWVIVYEVLDGDEVLLVRTGDHSVYGAVS